MTLILVPVIIISLLPIPVAAAVWPVPAIGLVLVVWPALYPMAYVLLTVLPLLPWRRPWARRAFPCMTLAVVGACVGLALVGGGPQAGAAVLVVFAPPVMFASVGLLLDWLTRRDDRRNAPGGRPLGVVSTGQTVSTRQ